MACAGARLFLSISFWTDDSVHALRIKIVGATFLRNKNGPHIAEGQRFGMIYFDSFTISTTNG
jgi:hypothetical protein